MTSQPNSQQSPPQSSGANTVGRVHYPDEDTRSGAENVNQSSAATAGDGPREGVKSGAGDLPEPGRHEQQPIDSANANRNTESRHVAETPRRDGEAEYDTKVSGTGAARHEQGEGGTDRPHPPSTTSPGHSSVAAEDRNVGHGAASGQTSAATEGYGQSASPDQTQSAHTAQPGHPGAAGTNVPPAEHPVAGQPTVETTAAEGHHPAATRGTAAGGTVGKGIKGIVSGVHGAGEAIRGNLTAGLDEAFGHTAGVEKNQQIAEHGVQQMRGGREAGRV